MDLAKITNVLCGTDYKSIISTEERLEKTSSENVATEEDFHPDELLLAANEVESTDYELTPLEKIAAAAYILEGDNIDDDKRGLATLLVARALSQSTKE